MFSFVDPIFCFHNVFVFINHLLFVFMKHQILKGAIVPARRNPRCHTRFLQMKAAGLVDKAICDMYDQADKAPEGKRQRQTNVIRDALTEYLSCCMYTYMLCWLHEASITIFFFQNLSIFLKN